MVFGNPASCNLLSLQIFLLIFLRWCTFLLSSCYSIFLVISRKIIIVHWLFVNFRVWNGPFSSFVHHFQTPTLPFFYFCATSVFKNLSYFYFLGNCDWFTWWFFNLLFLLLEFKSLENCKFKLILFQFFKINFLSLIPLTGSYEGRKILIPPAIFC